MSESCQRLSTETKTAANDIDWGRIVGFRNILVHDYLGNINKKIVQNVIEKELPILKIVMTNILCARTDKQAFSLVELSIVLVILGLLVGGVLTGQSLIRAAELRSVTTEFQKYQAAVNSFRDKYFALPGDMTNATSFWGKNNAACPSHSGTAATNGTCNGNGDGSILHITPVANATGEHLQFWKQLALSGMIEGAFTGTFSATAGTFEDGIVPRAKLPNGWWWEAAAPNHPGDADIYALDYGNYLSIGGSVLKPEEAWNIDVKVDDGKPAQGNVIGVFWNNLCAAADDGSSANNDLIASYRLTDTSLKCALIFRKAF